MPKTTKPKKKVWVLWDFKRGEFVRTFKTDVIAVTRRNKEIHKDFGWIEAQIVDDICGRRKESR